MRRGRDRCNRCYAPEKILLHIESRAERSELLSALGALMLDMTNDLGGAPPRRFLETGTVAYEVVRGAAVVSVPAVIVGALRARWNQP
jgi:hypothetical protein